MTHQLVQEGSFSAVAIHKSHSKNDTLKLIRYLGIDLGKDVTSLRAWNKQELNTHLGEWVKIKGTFTNPHNYMCLHTKKELVDFLQHTNPKKMLTVKQKMDIMLLCKQINHYSDNNFSLKGSAFESKEQVYVVAKCVAQHGDISTCRKCIAKLMADPCKLRRIEPTLSKIVRHELDQKQKLKTNYYTSLTCSRGRHVVTFD